MPQASTSLTMKDHIMAMPASVVCSGEIPCSQTTQAVISTATAGTQCALRLFSSAGSQTEAEFPDGVYSLVRAPAEQQGKHSSSYSSYPCIIRKTAIGYKKVQIGGELYAGQLVQQHNHRKTNLTAQGEVRDRMTTHTCCVCKKHYSHKRGLIRHLRGHTGEKPHVCSQCYKGFAQKCDLVNHERLHTGEKPYVCSVCEKSFPRSSNLARHEKLHSGKEPYGCGVCKKSFTRRWQLVRHERLHSGEKPYMCSTCKKRFVRKDELVKHERFHTGENSNVCSICQKSFTDNLSLARHKRTHSIQKSYACSVYEEKYVQNEDLLRHEEISTGHETQDLPNIPFPCTTFIAIELNPISP